MFKKIIRTSDYFFFFFLATTRWSFRVFWGFS